MGDGLSLDLERLFRECQSALLAMLHRKVGCHATASDLAQDTYLRLAKVPKSRMINSPRAFMFRTATNLALDHFRKEKYRGHRQVSLEVAEQAPSNQQPVDLQVYNKECVAALEKVLGTLSRRSQTIFVLRRVYGYSYREIADQLGLSERVVERHLVQTMARCQKAHPQEIDAVSHQKERNSEADTL